eukprot:TRINITY_DN13947_c0_g1_i1.p1 TRINITY_DN13947_c0_g1~~TRINITY_DN13947_c0_g1_i1.p1  ORF type:complete len:175 (-),score=24.04 TRINITY_DN13947_c0_g1_i1:403-927(-)
MERKVNPDTLELLQAPRTKGRFLFFICPLSRYHKFNQHTSSTAVILLSSRRGIGCSWVPILFDAKARLAMVCPAAALSEMDKIRVEYLCKAVKSRFSAYPGEHFQVRIAPAVPFESHVWSVYCLLIVLNYFKEGSCDDGDVYNMFDLAFMPDLEEAMRSRVAEEINAARKAYVV